MIYKTLKEISKKNKGFYGIGASSCEYNISLPQYLRITDISDDGRIPKILPCSININEYPDYKNYYLKNGDLLLARTGNSTGRNHLYKGISNSTVFAGFLIKFSIDENIINPNYVGYYCQSKQYYNQIESLITGSTRPNINAEQYGDLLIPIVDSSTQQHIVDTIGSVDDLIEKNEEIMQRFNTWLQSQYKSMICTCKEKINFGNFVERVNISADNNEWKNEQVIDLSSMPQDNICITTSSNGSDFTTNIKKLEEDTLLYGSIRPYFHKCGFTTGIKYVAGTVHSFKVINKKLITYILAVISSNEFHDYTNTNSQGTKMPIINWETFIKYEVCNLNEKDIECFYNNTYPIYEYIKKLINQNKKLLEIKNQLLNKYFD